MPSDVTRGRAEADREQGNNSILLQRRRKHTDMFARFAQSGAIMSTVDLSSEVGR